MTVGRMRGSLIGSNINATPGQATSSRVPISSSTGQKRMSLSTNGDVPSSTLKRTSSQASLSHSPAELSQAKRQLSSAQHEITLLKHAHERALLDEKTSKEALVGQVKELIGRCERLEKHRGVLLKKEAEWEEKEKSLTTTANDLRSTLTTQVHSLRSSLSSAQSSNSTLSARSRELEHELAQAIQLAKSEGENSEALEGELERLQAEIGEVRKDKDKEREEKRRLEQEVEILRSVKDEEQNLKVVKEELHRQVEHLRSLEKENGKLVRKVDTYEKQHANVELLKENNKSLEKRLRGMDSMRKRMAELEAELDASKREKSEWQAFLSPADAPEFSSPRKLSKTLAACRIENASYRERLDMAELEISRRDRMVGEFEARTAALEKELVEVKNTLTKAEVRAKGEESRQELSRKEIEMLKRHLATYTTEENMQHDAASSSQFDAQKTARLAELETLLDAHKTELADLSKQASHWRGLVERYGSSTTEILDKPATSNEDDTGVIVTRSLEEQLRKNEAVQQKLDQVRNSNALMLKEIEALELQVGRLTYEHGCGAYDARTTRVLQLRDNPDSQEHAIRTATLERLKEENSALLETIALLEARKGTSTAGDGVATVPRQSFENLQKDLQTAEASVKQKEIMELRLKKAFSDRADEFRKAVLSLLGYRLDFLSNGRVKVSSLYAPNKDYSLLFSSSAGGVGTMELLADDPDAEIQQMISYWVHEQGCIPAFLASLTLTLYDKQRDSEGR